jgi:DNA primase
MRTTSRNYFEATRTIKSAATAQDIETVVQNTLAKTDEIKEFDSELISRLHNTLITTDQGKDYFKSRNINQKSMSEFKLGYSAKQSMVIVPVQDQYGMYVGFVGRSIEGKSFKNSVGLPKKQILFNLNRVKFKNITVVESSFDAIRLWQLGIPAVATLGAIPSRIQIELLSKYATSIIICPDKDEAGEKMVSRITDNIVKKTVNVINVGNVKDVGCLTDEEIKELWSIPSISTFVAL